MVMPALHFIHCIVPFEKLLPRESTVNTYTVSKPEIYFVARHSFKIFMHSAKEKCQIFTQKCRILLSTYIYYVLIHIFMYLCTCSFIYMCVYVYTYTSIYVCFLFKIQIPMDQEYPERLKSGLEYR